jgi:HPt (histidine-containing phosphotransfer) domain-containing protein
MSPDDSILVDFARVDEYVGNDPRKILDFVFKFVHSARKDLVMIEAALECNDMTEVSAVAHRRSTPTLMVGARAFADLCRALDQSKGNMKIDQAREIVSQFSPLLERIEQNVRLMQRLMSNASV